MLVIRVCGGVEVEADGRLLPASLLAGRQGRLVLAYLACERHRAVPREELAELLWPGDLPASWTSSLHAVVSRLRKLLVEAGLDGGEALTSAGGAYRLVLPDDAEVDWELAHAGIADAERAVVAGDGAAAVAAASRASAIAGRGFLADDGAWADEQQEVARDLCVRAALAAAEGHLLEGKPARAVEAAREALGRDPLREAAFRVLMRALAGAGERAEALRVWERCRTTLVEELGVDPSPETEAVYLAVLHGGERQEPAPAATPAAALTALPSGVVTFLLTDIVESTVMWERHPAAMAAALERHDALVAEVVAAHGGTMLKSKLEGDATVSVFSRATAGALAALALRDALGTEPWPDDAAPKLRMAMHTGEAFERDGDYFGPALNRAARLRGLAGAGQVLLSQAVAELVRDHLPEGVALADRGHRDLRGLSRGENVYELAPADELEAAFASTALERPPLPPPLASPGPFVGRGDELARLAAVWERAALGEPQALLLAGEPGVGKSRLAAECARAAHDAGGLVLYGRCDEELGAPLQPFIEALRTLAPALGPSRLRAVRGIDELSRLVPELGELLPDAAPAARADPDSERYALFDATTELLCAASAEAPTLVVLDDLHWAGKTTLSLLRHLLRNAKDARLLVLGTYRDTELARTHPLAALLADLRRDRAADKLTLSGLEPEDVAAYLRAVGNPDRALGRELAEVTSGNPFFLIEALRHVEESGGTWEPGSLPEGVREATGRRLSQLSDATNEALSVAAVTGTTFDLALVERVSDVDVLDALGEAVQAGLIIEEPGAPGRFRFAHALVRQVLLAELVTIKRLRLHRTIAELLEAEPGPDPDVHLTDLAHHWFECALTGGGEKAVDACRRAADRARERLAYEEAGDLYGMAIQALDATEQVAEDDVAALHLARCDALLTAGDVTAARGAIDALGRAAQGSDRLTAWHTTYAGQLAVLAEPDRLDEIVASIGDAAAAMHAAGDLTGEATARYVHALALERLGRIGAAQRALDEALAAARTADDRRLADAILAEVPPAALWGPSPVTRASGNCLDVVRVLRITDGAPAVESVALRCQAVLEALRGRMDAARRMVASARRTVDQLGLVHRRLETDVSAGFIELLDRQAEAAEGYLRPAYEELRDRGLGGEAAQAAALLGRALLMQGRDDEAEAAAQEAEQLAGADLKAAIAWRDVRAEAAARRGDMALALDLAREAVELATATDALLLVADARLALATVLRASGDMAAAQAEAARAIEVCDAKGATALAEGARARAGEPADAPAASAERPAVPVSADALLDNAAVRWIRRYREVWAGGDWDAVAAFIGSGWDTSDRRLVAKGDWSVAESLRSLEQLFEGGAVPSHRPLALRGDRLALLEQTWTNTSPELEVTVLEVFELDEDLQGRHSTTYDLGDLSLAIEELDRRFAAGEAAEHAAIFETLTMATAAVNARDWELARTMFTDEFRLRDHSTTSVGSSELTADQWVDTWADVAAVWADAEMRIAHVPRVSSTAMVSVLQLAREGTGGDGPSERWWIQVYSHDGTRPTGLDVYPEDRYADALARFDELSTPVEDIFENRATRASRNLLAAMNEGDVEASLAFIAPDARQVDRRSILGTAIAEADIPTNLSVVLAGRGRMTGDLVATRGDDLCLVRSRWQAPQGEVELLAVTRSDETDRLDLAIWFDPEDLDAAYEELDRLAVESGVPYMPHLLWYVDRRDWAGAAATLAPDCVVEDHRPARLGRLEGRDQIIGLNRSRVDLSPDARARVEQTKIIGRNAIAMLYMAGEVDGSRHEVRTASVLQWDEQGRIRHIDLYDDTDLPSAIARFRELVAEEARQSEDGCHERFVNAAVRAARRLAAAVHHDDLDLAMSSFSPGFQLDDRRALIGMPVESDAHARSIRYLIAGRGEVSIEVLATRGDLLGLVRASWVGDRGEIPLLIVLRADDQDRYDAAVWFDADDLEAAHEELDRQYVELGAAPLFLKTKESVDALNARDWDAVEGLLAPDSVVDDHRPIRFGTLEGSAAFLDFQRSTAELTPDARLVVHHHLEEGRIGLRVMSLVGTIEGAPFQNLLVSLHQTDAAERVTRRDFYAPEQLDEALARFDELLAEQAAEEDDGCPERFVNAAVRTGRRLTRAMNDGDRDLLYATYLPGCSWDDRRALNRTSLDDVTSELGLDNLSFIMDLAGSIRNEVVATRGELLCLARVEFRTEDVEVDMLTLGQVDETEHYAHVTWFDPDDVDAAYEELHRRHLELGAEALYLAEHRTKETIDARDWDALEAMHAPDCVSEDHRPARFGVVRGSRAYVDLLRSGVDLSPDIDYVIHHHLAEGRVALSVISRAGTVEGGPFHNLIVDVLRRDARGLVAQRDFYGHDQLDAALARYDELVAAQRGPDDDGCHERFVNAAVRASRALYRAMSGGDVDGTIRCFTPDGKFQDRRPHFLSTADATGPAMREAVRFLLGAGTLQTEVLATRGERLSLSRTTWTNDGAEAAIFWIAQADDQDLLEDVTWLDPDDLDAAYAELDARFVAYHDGMDRDRHLERVAGVDAYAQDDLDPVLAHYAPGLEVEDHRGLGFGTLDLAGWTAHMRRLKADAPGSRLRIHHLRMAPGAVIHVNTIGGAAPSGEFELAAVHVNTVGADGLDRRIDIYGWAQLDEAFAQYDRLRSGSHGADPFAVSTPATENSDRFVAALRAGDRDALAALFAPGFVATDRRRFSQVEAAGSTLYDWLLDPDALIELTGTTSWSTETEILATRGERLALGRTAQRFGTDTSPLEREFLVVLEVDEAGRRTEGVLFDPDDLDAAYAELDARYGESSPLFEGMRAFRAHDWDGFAALFEDGAAVHDHRTVGWGPLDVRGLVARYRMTTEMSPDARARLYHVLDRAEGACLAALGVEGTHDGGAFERRFLAASAWRANGRFTAWEIYDLEDVERARTRFAELVAEAEGHRFWNAAMASAMRWREVWKARDWDALMALHAKGYVGADRRRAAQVEGMTADQSYRDFLWLDESEFVVPTLVATRGDRLALMSSALRFSDGASGVAQVDFLSVIEVDEAGLYTGAVTFDPDDLEAAYDEVDARYGPLEPLDTGLRAFNARDWDGLAALFEDTAVVDDHRLLSWGRLDLAGLLDRYRATVEVAPDTRARVDHVLDRTDTALLVAVTNAGTHDGGRFELLSLMTFAWRPHGRFTVLELFDPDDFGRAWARFEELAAAEQPFTNAAMRSAERVAELWRTDRGAVTTLFAAGNVYDERRRASMMEGITAEASLEQVMGIRDSEWSRPRVIATRGDRLALWSTSFRFTDGVAGPAEAELLVVGEVDDAGLRVATVSFDPDDLDAAYDELDRRYVAQGGHDIGGIRRGAAAGDLEGLAAQLTPSFHIVDHRVLGMAGTTRKGYLRDIREMGELAPDNRIEVHHVLATNPLAVHSLCRVYGTYEGGEFETPIVFVGGFSSGERWWVWELYGEDQLDEARVRYEELADPSAVIPNLAERTLERLRERYDERDWDGIGAICVEGFVFEDRSSHVQGGRDMFLDNGRALAEQGATLRRELLAAPGDRVCLVRRSAGDGDSYVMEHLQVVEVDDEGSFRAFVTFDGKDRTGASIEVARRQGAISGAPQGVFTFIAALNTHDVDGVRASLARCRFEDHRRGRPGVLNDLDDYIKSLEAGFALTEGLVAEQLRHFAEGPHGTVTLTRTYGLREGGALETLFISVVCWDDEALTNLAVYECEDLERALAKFEELRPPS